jgi:inosine-uridine nucleoside N-ribohydrolase
MVGLDATNRAIISFDQIAELERSNGPVSHIVGQLLRFFAGANRRAFGLGGAPIHDALAIAAVIDPDIVQTGDYYVAIETQGELTLGQTVTDIHGVTNHDPNARVALGVDTQRFSTMMLDALRTLDDR